MLHHVNHAHLVVEVVNPPHVYPTEKFGSRVFMLIHQVLLHSADLLSHLGLPLQSARDTLELSHPQGLVGVAYFVTKSVECASVAWRILVNSSSSRSIKVKMLP